MVFIMDIVIVIMDIIVIMVNESIQNFNTKRQKPSFLHSPPGPRPERSNLILTSPPISAS